MTKNSKTIAIVLVVVIISSVLFLGYYFFLKPKHGSFASGSLVRGGVVGIVGSESLPDYGSLSSQTGRELLFLLDDLRSITFDSSVIQNVGFNNLADYSRTIEPQKPGRANPFAPLQ